MPSLLVKFSFVLSLFAILFLGQACQTDKGPQSIDLHGKTMGTTYNISYFDSLNRDFSSAVDSLLLVINQEVSTYIPNSTISKFNQSDSGISIPLKGSSHFVRNFKLSGHIYAMSGGWFNPAVMPLVNYWGFGYTDKKPVEKIDSALVDSLRKLCNFDAAYVIESSTLAEIRKMMPKLQLDFSAVAKGDAVDQIGLFLESQGIKSYMVEIGGELRCRGFHHKNLGWHIGINTPSPDAALDDVEMMVEMLDMSLATSGNYRNFHEASNGQKYAHTINPHSGYPEQSNLLSASIFAKDCATADALATACMAMGLDKAFALIQATPGIEGYFIYSDSSSKLQSKYTEGAKDWLKD